MKSTVVANIGLPIAVCPRKSTRLLDFSKNSLEWLRGICTQLCALVTHRTRLIHPQISIYPSHRPVLQQQVGDQIQVQSTELGEPKNMKAGLDDPPLKRRVPRALFQGLNNT